MTSLINCWVFYRSGAREEDWQSRVFSRELALRIAKELLGQGGGWTCMVGIWKGYGDQPNWLRKTTRVTLETPDDVPEALDYGPEDPFDRPS